MDYFKRAEIEKDEKWLEWIKKIPHLQFKENWKIKILPPFSYAMVRFRVDKDNNYVSVYLDCYDRLGYFGEPYWEVYPYKDDIYRVKMNNTDELMKIITEVINI